MGMSSTIANVGSVLNSGLSQIGNQQGPGDVSIGMPYGPGYTQPNQDGQPTGPGNVSIGMPAGPGYMQPTLSSGGKAGAIMPTFPANEVEPLIGFRSPNLGQPQIGMPYGPGYQQPTPLPSTKPTTPPGAYLGLHNGLGQPSIGLPYGPGWTNPGGVPGSIKGYPTSPASQFNTISPIERQMQNQKFNQPAAAPVAQFNPASTMTPLQRQAMAQKANAPQSIAQTVGLRKNPVKPMTRSNTVTPTVQKPWGY